MSHLSAPPTTYYRHSRKTRCAETRPARRQARHPFTGHAQRSQPRKAPHTTSRGCLVVRRVPTASTGKTAPPLMRRSTVQEDILTGLDALFDTTGVWLPGVSPDHRVIHMCKGCHRWQLDIGVDDLDALDDAQELARRHFRDCTPLHLAIALNRWWSAVATRPRAPDDTWIGDLLDQLRPLAAWHRHPDTDEPVLTIARCRFCDWQTDAPTVALYDEWTCLYALNEHRQDCTTLATMAALVT